MRARVMVAVAGASGLLLQPGHALADPRVGLGGFVEDGTPVAQVDAIHSSGGTGQGGGETVRCEYTRVPNYAWNWPSFESPLLDGDAFGDWYERRCHGPSGDQVGHEYWLDIWPVGSTPAAVLAARAVRRLPLPTPEVGTSPPVGREQLVNLATWLWVRDDWAPRSATASAAGVAVTVTARPVRVVWQMGDGEHVVCYGPGRAYDPRLRAGAQSTDCAYTYRRSSSGQPHQRYRVRVTMIWDVTWTAIGVAGGGDLGEVSRSTTLGLRVVEGQALVTGSA